MRVFVAGATGAIGKQLVPRLVAAGHEVHGMTRSESKQAMLHELGAVPVVADAPTLQTDCFTLPRLSAEELHRISNAPLHLARPVLR